MSEIIMITGASAGIGEACARVFAKNKNRLIITGRRKDHLEKLAEELRKEHKTDILPLSLDVRSSESVHQAVSGLSEEWKNIDILVNNAGLSLGLDPIDKGLIQDWDTMIDTNIKGLLYVTRAVIPFMVERKRGHIINIGSISGKEVYPGGSVYCATKHAVDALTKGMRMDLLSHDIRVSAIHPGAAETEFSYVRFKGDVQKAKNVYKGIKPLTGMDVANAVYYVTTLPEHVNVNELIIMATAQANSRDFNRK